jgi:predicted Zn-dependent peptidase
VILDEPRGAAAGVAVIINAGSAWEMRPEAGLTYLAARSVVEELRPVLDPLGGRAAAECDPSGVRFSLSLPAATWEEGTKFFLEAIFGQPFSDGAIARARRAILAESALSEESISTEIRTALAGAEFGDGDRWARPACGTPETIASLSAADARRMAQSRFTPYRATAAVAGPVGEAVPRSLLSHYLPDSDLPVLIAGPKRKPGKRIRQIERNTVTAWIGIAFPFPREADLEALRLLTFLIEREVVPAPTRPEIYDATVELSPDGGGGALVVYLVTAPTHAREWMDRVSVITAAAAERELPEPAFEALQRRFTGQRLLELETPEARAREAALQLFFEHGFTPPIRRIAALTPAALQGVAALLGAPAIVLLGPR